MQESARISVLRLGHRPGRDERTTTHVGLTARALGADSVILAGEAAGRGGAIEDITARFGGPFEVDTTAQPHRLIREWEGVVVHLTMYGLPVQEVVGSVREEFQEGCPVLVVVGAGKVPFEVYEEADFNVAVTNQPHSEIASLAVFLDRLFEGHELDREWKDAERVVLPEECGKRVEER